MSRPSPVPSRLVGAASRTARRAALTAAMTLCLSFAIAGPSSAQDAEFPGPDSPECTWAGERILSLLWRDDIRTASDFLDLYDRFDCPSEHVAASFRCLVQVGVSPEQGDPGLPTRARACWGNPALDPASLQTAEQPGQPTADGQGDQPAKPPEGEPPAATGQQPAAQ